MRTLVRLAAACALLVAVSTVGLSAQTAPAGASVADESSKTWIGRHAQIEAFLRDAPIAECEDIPVGVTSPIRCDLEGEGPVNRVAWKKVHGRHKGFWDSYKADIAAYELDKLLGLDMVPPCVEKRVNNDPGGASMWVENTQVWKIDEPVRGPDPVAWDRQVVRMKMFDNLVGNTDRNAGNLLVDPAYNLILIDHSRGFTSGKKLPTVMSRIDREFWAAMNTLTIEQLQTALGKWIDRGQIRDILARRDLMKKEIDKLVAQRGEAAFIR